MTPASCGVQKKSHAGPHLGEKTWPFSGLDFCQFFLKKISYNSQIQIRSNVHVWPPTEKRNLSPLKALKVERLVKCPPFVSDRDYFLGWRLYLNYLLPATTSRIV